MRHPDQLTMLKQHYNDIVETIDPPSYQSGALYAMSLVVHIMLVCHEGNEEKVVDDIRSMAVYAIECVKEGEVKSAQRALH